MQFEKKNEISLKEKILLLFHTKVFNTSIKRKTNLETIFLEEKTHNEHLKVYQSNQDSFLH